MAKRPIYDPDSLRADIKREEENIRVFNEEVEKAKERKMQLEFYLNEALSG
ncbi:MAG: hypothetical protein J7L15_09680 [Clostridiales bacterium]|nr:hypothetical protein [Clostridiales bacterium]